MPFSDNNIVDMATPMPMTQPWRILKKLAHESTKNRNKAKHQKCVYIIYGMCALYET